MSKVKPIPIDPTLHKKIKIKVAEGKYKTIRDFVEKAVVKELAIN